MSRNSSIEESAAWGEGYDAAMAGIEKTIETARNLATKQERYRIKRLINMYLLTSGQLIWHMDKEMTRAEFIQLVESGEG